MKILSGDFVAMYNRTMNEYVDEQKKLEAHFEEKIKEIIQVETARLEATFPMPFNPGDKVITTDGKRGVVQSCPVDLNFMEDEDYHGPKCGPNKFFKIRNESDEEVLTCEGLVRSVKVRLEDVTQLEMDWGVTSRNTVYWPDDLSKVDD